MTAFTQIETFHNLVPRAFRSKNPFFEGKALGKRLNFSIQLSGKSCTDNIHIFFPLNNVFSTFDMEQLGKILPDHWKERLKIIKTDKFESDLLKTHEDIALQSCKNLQMFGCQGASLFPHHTNVCSFSIKTNCCVLKCSVCVFKIISLQDCVRDY